MLKTEIILDFPVIAEPLDACLHHIAAGLAAGRRIGMLACLNPHSIVVSHRDAVFQEALFAADLLVPDGVGIIAASRIGGGGIRKRITGSDIFHGVSRSLNQTGGRVFFLGSTEKNLASIRLRMVQMYPNVKIAGTYSPPFKDNFSDNDNAAMVQAVNKAKPDVLWVGMTAPKQEKWAYRHRHQLDARFIGAVGAVFDFFSGNVKRSHPLFQEFGLEWLPRLLRQPGRLWKRNLISTPKFILSIIRSLARK